MKKIVFITLVILACNQKIYDQIYDTIVQRALDEIRWEPEKKVFTERNDAIELLRKLCNGQKSTYEKGD